MPDSDWIDVNNNDSDWVDVSNTKSLMPKGAEVATDILGGALGASSAIGGSYLLGKGIKKVAPKARNLFLTEVGGYSKPTVETIEKTGFKNIINIQKQGIDKYLSNIIPQVKDKVLDYFTTGKIDTDILETFGFEPEDIEDFGKVSKESKTVLKNLKGKTLSSTLSDIKKVKTTAGKTIGRAENLAKQIGVTEYIPKTYRTIKGELNRLGYLKGDTIAQDISSVKDKALQGLLKEFSNLRKDPMYQYDISDIQKLRTNLEASLGGEKRFDRIIYKALDILNDEHISNIDRYDIPSIKNLNITQAKKEYSDSIRLENISKKLSNILEKEPSQFIERFKGSISDIFKEPTRQKFVKLFGQDLYDKLKSAVATSEIYPLKQTKTGIFPSVSRTVSKGLFRTMQGAKRVSSAGTKAIAPLIMLTDAAKVKLDPEAYEIAISTGQDFWKVVENLAPKGSEERKIQLGQIL